MFFNTIIFCTAMSNNTEFTELAEELLAFQQVHGGTAKGRRKKSKNDAAVLVARLLPGVDLGHWREFCRNNLSGRWCALPVGPALFSEADDTGETAGVSPHLAKILLNELVTEQIQRELLRLSRTGGELAIMEVTLQGREALSRELPTKTMDALDSGLVTCLAQCREECDSLGNTGPGRYVLVLPGVGLLHARLMAEDMQKKFSALAAKLCAAKGGDGIPPVCAVGIACFDSHERSSPPMLLQQCEHALHEALEQRNGHISIAGGDGLDKRNTLVHSSEKRFLFFGSN